MAAELVRLDAAGAPLATGACHCTGCQRMTGGSYSLGAIYPLTAVSIEAGETGPIGAGSPSQAPTPPPCRERLRERPLRALPPPKRRFLGRVCAT